MSEESLKAIVENLEDIKALLLLIHSADIQKAKTELLKAGSEQERVYQLCEGTTSLEISTAIGKSMDNANAVISSLRRKGLIKTVEKDGKKVHDKRF